ncbi:hypothetical protein [Streptomyces sp. 3N207]|uniref:hypothetical protein n=1 Tax=Streptomyces sp. 3N207 TaxID=3457417 RepID=UPI003FD2CEEC
MTRFLETLGQKVAEHWLNLVVLPGVLWVATVLLASRLGWAHAVDPQTLGRGVDEWAKSGHSSAVIVVIVAGSSSPARRRDWRRQDWERWRGAYG